MPKRYAAASFASFTARAGPAPIINAATRRSQGRVRAPACTDAAAWEHGSKVAVNVSPLQLAHADLPRLFHEIMLETGLPPHRLEIELTESAIMADRDRSLHVLRQIKALGIGVALDDFGTGYSSLETLRAFPFDKIKLDRLFTAELADSPQATAIIRAVRFACAWPRA